jgi:hypothetical protein
VCGRLRLVSADVVCFSEKCHINRIINYLKISTTLVKWNSIFIYDLTLGAHAACTCTLGSHRTGPRSSGRGVENRLNQGTSTRHRTRGAHAGPDSPVAARITGVKMKMASASAISVQSVSVCGAIGAVIQYPGPPDSGGLPGHDLTVTTRVTRREAGEHASAVARRRRVRVHACTDLTEVPYPLDRTANADRPPPPVPAPVVPVVGTPAPALVLVPVPAPHWYRHQLDAYTLFSDHVRKVTSSADLRSVVGVITSIGCPQIYCRSYR